MNALSRFDLRKRYILTLFIVIFVSACLLILVMYHALNQYMTAYISQYWKDYTNTFAESIKYPVIMGSISNTETMSKNFIANDKIVKVSVFNSQQVLLSSAFAQEKFKNIACQSRQTPIDTSFFIETQDYWCFYSPIQQESIYLGHVELIAAKSPFKSMIKRFLLFSVVVSVLFSIIIFVAIGYYSNLYTTLLLNISQVLLDYNQGKRGKRIAFSGISDLDKMCETFNEVLEKIELHEQTLEQRVATRTNELMIALDNSQAANRYKHQIIAMVTHEMKTPLHAIMGFLQSVRRDLPPSPDFDLMRTFHTRALIRADELNKLIENMLLQGKLEASRFELSYSTISVKGLILACLDKIHTKNQNHVTLLGDDIRIVSDADALTHILGNLLSNAFKFTTHGLITLKWWLTPNQFWIQVIDTGCGIPQELRDQIFDPFWQVDMTLSRKYSGHGLGLAIVQQFIQRLNGLISVESNSEQGSIFTVILPISETTSVHPL